MIRPLLFAALVALPAVAGAQTSPAVAGAQTSPAVAGAQTSPAVADAQASPQATDGSGTPPQRVRSVTLSAGQKCPQSSGEEIVICSTLDQPYRIPKQFRDSGPIPAQNQAWGNRAATVDQVSRVAGGLPDTCSPVGTGGQSGCALATNRQWAAERRAQRDAENQTP